jgi:hypothetical protein
MTSTAASLTQEGVHLPVGVGKVSFRTRLEEVPGEIGSDRYVAFFLPPEAEEAGATGRVVGTIDGHPFAAATSPTGDGRHMVYVTVEMRRETGLQAGAEVIVVLEPEIADERPDLDVPDDVRRALAESGLGLDFEQLPWERRRELLEEVAASDGPEERARRVERAMEAIRVEAQPGREEGVSGSS